MSTNVIGYKYHEDYLIKCAIDSKFSFGLIIGQPTLDKKIYIVHLAKNQDIENSDIDIETYEHEDKSVGFLDNTNFHIEDNKSFQFNINSTKEIVHIKNTTVANHVINVTKMLPGSFFVLGIFVVGETCIFDNKADIEAAKEIIKEINTTLRRHKYLCGNSCLLPKGKLILSYAKSTKKIYCKLYNTNDETLASTYLEFRNEHIVWHMFETSYEFDDVFPIIEQNHKIRIEQHFEFTLESITSYLESSEYFILNEPMNEKELLESYIKGNSIEHEDINTMKKFKVNIFMPTVPSAKDPIIVEKYKGLIRFSGIVSSRIWTHSKQRFDQIQIDIQNDIIRSLASRIQIYCDGLIDAYAPNESIIVSEPPRRVYFNIPYLNGIQFSEYIFRGETPSVAYAQSKYLLDVEIDSNMIDSSLEGLVDFDDINSLSNMISYPLVVAPKAHDYGRFMYMAGMGTAILILIIAILFHFSLR